MSLWVVDLESFVNLEKLLFVPWEYGNFVFGAEIEESYKNPPGKIISIFSEFNGFKYRETLENHLENVRLACKYWKEHDK